MAKKSRSSIKKKPSGNKSTSMRNQRLAQRKPMKDKEINDEEGAMESEDKRQVGANTESKEKNSEHQGNQKDVKKEMSILDTVKEIFSPVKPVDHTLEKLFEDSIKDIYSAEKQLIQALPKLAQATHSEELSHAFITHYRQTRKQAESLEKIMAYLRISPGGKKCAAMEGLIKETDDIIRHYNESPVRDSALIICAQKVEHYEIASYGSLCELAEVLGLNKIQTALERILDEEKKTDKLLTQHAMDSNDEAVSISSSQKKVGKKQRREA